MNGPISACIAACLLLATPAAAAGALPDLPKVDAPSGPGVEAPAPEERPMGRTWWPYMIGSAAAAAMSTTGITYAVQHWPDSDSSGHSFRRFETAFDIGCFGITASGVLAITGLVLHITWSPHDPLHPLNLAEADRPLSRKWWPYWAGSAAAMVIGFGLLYANWEMPYEENRTHHGVDVYKLTTIGYYSGFAFSAILAITGMALHITWDPNDAASPAPSPTLVGPVVMLGGGGLSLAFAF